MLFEDIAIYKVYKLATVYFTLLGMMCNALPLPHSPAIMVNASTMMLRGF